MQTTYRLFGYNPTSGKNRGCEIPKAGRVGINLYGSKNGKKE